MKYISYVRYALIALSALFVFLGVYNEAYDLMLGWAEALVIITIVTLLGLGIYSSVKNPMGATRSLVGTLCVIVILAISYAMSDTTPIETPANVFDVRRDLIIADTGLYATYFTAFIAVLSIALTEIYNLIKK